MPTPINVLTGIDTNSAFLIAEDTRQRYENVFNESKKPISYPIDFGYPYDGQTGLSEEDLLNMGDRQALKNALNGNNPELKNRAISFIGETTNTQPFEAGLGKTTFVPYYKWQDKYLNDEFGYDPNMSLEQNEQWYYENQWLEKSFFEKTLATAGKFHTRVIIPALLKLGQGFGYVGALAIGGLANIQDAFKKEDSFNVMDFMANNAFSRVLTELEEDLKNSSFASVYKPSGWDNKGFFEKMKYAAFWTDEYADGIAFLLSAAIPAGWIGKAGKGVSLLTRKATTYNRIMRAAGLETLGDVGAVAYNMTMESAVEAAEGFRTLKEEYLERRRNGDEHYKDLTDRQIDLIVGEVASKRFRANLGILAISNLFENKFFFRPMVHGGFKRGVNIRGSSVDRVKAYATMEAQGKLKATEVTKNLFKKFFLGSRDGKFINWNARLPFYAKRIVGSSIAEGLWEENAQLAVERWSSQESYIGIDGTKIMAERNLKDQYIKQTLAAFRGEDPANSTSIGLGALIGMFGSTVVPKVFGGRDPKTGKIRFFYGERKTHRDQALQAIKDYNEAYENMLRTDDLFDFDADGNSIFNKAKAEQKVEALVKFGMTQVTINDMKNEVLRKKLSQDLFARYVAAAVAAGVDGKLISRLNELSSASPEQLTNLGLNVEDLMNDPKLYVERTKELVGVYNKLQDNYTTRDKDESIDDYNKRESQRRYFAYLAYARMRSSEDARNTFSTDLSKIEGEVKNNFSALSTEYPLHLADLNEYNKRVIQQESLLIASEEFDFFGKKDMVEDSSRKIAELEQEKKDILSRIPEDIRKTLIEDKTQTKIGALLVDPKIDETGYAPIGIMLNFVKQLAYMETDIAINRILYEKLSNEKNGAQSLKDYHEYLANRKVAEEEGDTIVDPEILKAENEVLKEAVEALEKLKQETPEDPQKTDEEIDAEIEANKAKIKENEQKIEESEAVEKEVEKELKDEEISGNIPLEDINEKTNKKIRESGIFVEHDGKKYFSIPEIAEDKSLTLADNIKLSQELREKLAKELAPEMAEEQKAVLGTPYSAPPSDSVVPEEDEEKLIRWYTPFGTIHRSSTDVNDYTEELNDSTYVAAINAVTLEGIDTDLYQPVIVKDNEKLWERFTKEEREKNKEDEVEFGEVLVFKKRGVEGEYLTIKDVLPTRFTHLRDKPVVMSIDDPDVLEQGFNPHRTESAIIYARRLKTTIEEAEKFYKSQENVRRHIRNVLEKNPHLEIPVKITLGGSGIFPTTKGYVPIASRFSKFKPTFTVITKENISRYPGVKLGHVYATFDGFVDSSSHLKVLPVQVPFLYEIDTFSLEESPEATLLARTIKSDVMRVLSGEIHFQKHEHALQMIHNFLEKVVYTNKDHTVFKIVKGTGESVVGGYTIKMDVFKIELHRKNLEGVFEKVSDRIPGVRINLNKKIYAGEEVLYLFDENLQQFVPQKHAHYKEMMDGRFITDRKIVVKKGKLFLDPLNPYFDLKYEQTVEDFEKEFDAAVSEDIKKAINDLSNNVKGLELDDTDDFYIVENPDGSVTHYARVSNFLSGYSLFNYTILPDGTYKIGDRILSKEEAIEDLRKRQNAKKKENPLRDTGAAVGNRMDTIVRDFFNNTLKSYDEYKDKEGKHFITSEKVFDSFITQLEKLQAAFILRGEKILANNITVYDDVLKVAGTIDLLSIDKNGVIRIYDMKTTRANPKTGEFSFEEKANTSYDGKPTNFETWSKQISLYRILLNNTFGLKAKTIGILPIGVSYNAGSPYTSKAELLPGMALSILDIVNEASIREKTTETEEKTEDTLEKKKQESIEVLDYSQQIADIERRRQEELKAVPVGSSTMYKNVKDGENTELTEEEQNTVEELIQAFVEKGETDVNKVISYLQRQGFIRGPYVSRDAQRAYIQARLNGTNIPVNGRVQESINAKYDAEYVEAVKKGEMTKEQAMQALEKVGRKDSEIYKQISGASTETTPAKTIEEQITELETKRDAEITPLQEELDLLEEELRKIEAGNEEDSKELGEAAVDDLVEKNLTENEIDGVKEELGIETDEEVKEEVKRALKEDLKENGAKIVEKKSFLSKVVNKLKKLLVAIFLGGTIFSSIYATTHKYSLSDIESFATRGLVKYGFYTPEEQVLEVKVDSVIVAPVVEKTDSTAIKYEEYKKSVTRFEKISQTKDGLWSYRNQFMNEDGFEYVVGMNNRHFKEDKTVTYKGVVGIAHHMIMRGKADDLTHKTSDADLLETSRDILKNTPKHHWIPIIKRLPNDRVHITYVKVEEAQKLVNDSSTVFTPIRLRQTVVSDLDFSKASSAEGFKSNIKAVTQKSTGQGFNSLVYLTKKDYSKFGGGTVVLLFYDVNKNLIVREYSGSIIGIQNEIAAVEKQFNVTKDDIILGVYDAGSYTGKVGAKNNVVSPKRYYDYNTDEKAGSSLMIPVQSEDSDGGALGAMSLLIFLANKRKNNEEFGSDDIALIRARIKELSDKINDIRKDYDSQIEELRNRLPRTEDVLPNLTIEEEIGELSFFLKYAKSSPEAMYNMHRSYTSPTGITDFPILTEVRNMISTGQVIPMNYVTIIQSRLDSISPKEKTVSTEEEPDTIEKARERLRQEELKAQEGVEVFNLGRIFINFETSSPTVVRNEIKEREIPKAIEEFTQAAMQIAMQDPDVFFGEKQTKTSKIYFFGHKKYHTFVIFDNKLRQIKNERKFKDQNPEIYQEIENNC